ncbi:MAG: recombinase family protein [Nitrospinae bacterium]|nr:recombinase family protein [Nitrospinota bacterium]
MNKKRVALYARVSTSNGHQNPEAQLLDLRRYAKERGFKVFQEYVDRLSGTIEKRPALDKLMEDAGKKRFDAVLVWRFDRFARSTKHLVESLHTFRHIGISFISFQENIDTGSPLGEAIFTIISAISQLERDIIKERVKSGLRRAREKGTQLGRPRVSVDPKKAKRMQKDGLSLRETATAMGVPRSTLSRLLGCPKNPGNYAVVNA